MAVVMIGVDPHKASHTAAAINAAEEPLGQLRVRASAVQAERLLGWDHARRGPAELAVPARLGRVRALVRC